MTTSGRLLQRRPVTAGEIKLIGKESNRLEDRFTGLLTVDELEERPVVYHDNDGWRRITLPKLRGMVARRVAEQLHMSERPASEILKGRATPMRGTGLRWNGSHGKVRRCRWGRSLSTSGEVANALLSVRGRDSERQTVLQALRHFVGFRLFDMWGAARA